MFRAGAELIAALDVCRVPAAAASNVPVYTRVLVALTKIAAPLAREAIPAEAIPAVTARATATARIIFFIGILRVRSGRMSGFDQHNVDLSIRADNLLSGHRIYAPIGGMHTHQCSSLQTEE